MLLKRNWWITNFVRYRASFSNFKQWKDLMVFKRSNGHSVWNLPKFIPHEYGFRRLRRKPPFFKIRKYAHPKITANYSPDRDIMYNRTVFIRYGWIEHAKTFYNIKEHIEETFQGINVVGVAEGEGYGIAVVSERGKTLFHVNTRRDLGSVCNEISQKILEDI
ncbi:conserved hypothetical protein [Theileria equi strain WA]|uniref:Uncharacterized protein n=1 Tax=Theileria equi strain WA TaxID=1537102 RepID=L1LD75_THEEQ|nr:conserved hypothetical protein [Theileria equi strain WA]EKX73128.1 conserved hypothetical protein [Theileria equi strain WA]|eukprot:XP_004832580.1 conserved hypothetical protein [Theileria equi strain WA]